MANNPTLISAAGGVLWRPSRKHGIKVAVIHRPRYDDWSLPKGKAEPGETDPITAARELVEETGLTVALGRSVTTVSYPVAAGTKSVRYFAARAIDGDFIANREVDELDWMPVHKAHQRLTYHYDRTVLDAFTSLPANLATIVLVRHAHAGQRDAFDGEDTARPLDARGWRQAADLARHLVAFGPNLVSAAPLTRCEQTVQPLADHLRIPVGTEPTMSEAQYQLEPAAARKRLAALAVRAGSERAAVVCSQGGVIPGVIKSLAARADLTLPTTGTPKAAYWVLSFDGKRLRQADRYTPNEP